MDKLKKIFKTIIGSRLLVFMVVAIIMFSLLVQRLFVLQIVKGESYKDNYTLLIERSRDVEATRGNIYDKNGVLLAYNELAYSVTIVDEGNYRSSEQNQVLNKIVDRKSVV